MASNDNIFNELKNSLRGENKETEQRLEAMLKIIKQYDEHMKRSPLGAGSVNVAPPGPHLPMGSGTSTATTNTKDQQIKEITEELISRMSKMLNKYDVDESLCQSKCNIVELTSGDVEVTLEICTAINFATDGNVFVLSKVFTPKHNNTINSPNYYMSNLTPKHNSTINNPSYYMSNLNSPFGVINGS